MSLIAFTAVWMGACTISVPYLHTPGRGAIKSPRSTQPSIPPG